MTKKVPKVIRELKRIGHQIEDTTKKAREEAEALAQQAQIQAQQLLETQRRLSMLQAVVAIPAIIHIPPVPAVILTTAVASVIPATPAAVEPPRKLSQ